MTLSLSSLADRDTGNAGAAPGDRGMAGVLGNLALCRNSAAAIPDMLS